ncbi:MAG: response regulator [Cellulomonas sp.]
MIATNGSEQAFDVIVLDVMLPGMSGHDVCHHLRDRGDTTPLLFLTAKVGAGPEVDKSVPSVWTKSVISPQFGSESRAFTLTFGPGVNRWADR